MKCSTLNRLFFIFLLSFTSSVFSLTFDNPYVGNVIAGNKSEQELKVLALKQVLVKVSGNTKIASLAGSQKLLKHPERLLSQFSFQRYRGNEYYVVLFQDRKINQAIVQMNQPIWGVTRPKTLIWYAQDLNGRKDIISETDVVNGDNWALISAPSQRGISLQFPLMDLEDRALTPTDIKGHFYSNIIKASKRYNIQNVAVAYMRKTGSKWNLSFKLVQPDMISKKNIELISAEYIGSRASVQIRMVNAIADYYAGQYAIIAGSGEKFVQPIFVNKISSFDKFAQLTRILEQLSSVSEFQITTLDDQSVQVNVTVNGGVNAFKNAFTANRHITRIAEKKEVITAEDSATLSNNDAEHSITQKEATTEKATVEHATPEHSPLYFNWR